MPELYVVPIEERPLTRALRLSAALVARSRSLGAPALASSLVKANARVLGARQSGSRAPDGSVLRRLTLGTTARISGVVLWHALALPRPDALARDGSRFNLLNRNLRGFISGYTTPDAGASYVGREFLSVGHRPCGLVGYDVYADGAALLEVVVGLDAPVLLDASRGRERSTPLLGPAAYAEVARRPVDAGQLARRVETGFARRFGRELVTLEVESTALDAGDAPEAPPATAKELGARAVPLGWLRAMMYGPTFRVEGELLGSTAALERFEALVTARITEGAALGPELLEVFGELPLEAVRPEDLLDLAQRAQASVGLHLAGAVPLPAPTRAVDPE